MASLSGFFAGSGIGVYPAFAKSNAAPVSAALESSAMSCRSLKEIRGVNPQLIENRFGKMPDRYPSAAASGFRS
jgi:hypothetical protein